ncbi:glycoside hydrolase family 15 protein [Streptomyces sp. NPDC047525]|uniref:glycoside hydrolase family 15 protein n=1 Tax=Streptomyces sp. NPDC047525 TaxID=3155264 RepID=UPI0033C6222E
MARRIEDHAFIGDLQTAALVRRDGTINWLCLPRFDSAAIFAGLLGTNDNGGWRIGPAPLAGQESPPATRRSYRGDSLVLESQWDTPTGTLKITDLMPPREGPPRLIRIVEALTGTVEVASELCVRFGYGKVVPWVSQVEGRMCALAGPDAVWLDTDGDTRGEQPATEMQFTLEAGERLAFTLSWQPSHAGPPEQPDANEALETTEKFWAAWVSQCTYAGEHREAVVRSLITLKALTYAPTGGIIAAPTTSLPEDIGGVRNWDYRYVWLRDAAIAMSCLLSTGYRDEARAWRSWLLRAVAGDPENLQIMYGVAGERELPESELGWLTGYQESLPVRVGNAAAQQRQLDVYGEVVEALYLAAHVGLELDEPSNHLLGNLVEAVRVHWELPDDGIWEVRGPQAHFVHSKVMAWVAVDRAIKLVEGGHAQGPLELWRELRDAIHQTVCERGFDPERNTFTQSYGSTELDAALLLIPQVGFLRVDDPRTVGTVEAIQRHLSTSDGLVLRYPTEGTREGMDGLPGDEGAFLVCSFWLVEDLALIGRLGEARTLFDRLLTKSNDVGLLAEEWDPRLQQQVGNYPQAFSACGVVSAALALERGARRQPSGIEGGLR